jgi:hypothetical protein
MEYWMLIHVHFTIDIESRPHQISKAKTASGEMNMKLIFINSSQSRAKLVYVPGQLFTHPAFLIFELPKFRGGH